jgi:hypothetical protein
MPRIARNMACNMARNRWWSLNDRRASQARGTTTDRPSLRTDLRKNILWMGRDLDGRSDRNINEFESPPFRFELTQPEVRAEQQVVQPAVCPGRA